MRNRNLMICHLIDLIRFLHRLILCDFVEARADKGNWSKQSQTFRLSFLPVTQKSGLSNQ